MDDATEQILDDLRRKLRFAKTDWLTATGALSLKLLEQGIAIGQTLGEVSWDEAVVAFQRHAQALIAEGMVQPPDDQRLAALAAIHVHRHNPGCVCRTEGCGHRADQHTGPNGACSVCEKECWL